MIGIYMFENIITHQKYIGQSVNITKRKWEHYNNPSPYSKIDELLIKDKENFTFTIIEECSVNDLDKREQYWIDFYDTINNGYNLINGGNCYRGENNTWAKLNNKQVLEIIKLLEHCEKTNREISNLYNVSIGTIDLINRCKIWCHLHNYSANIRQENLNKKTFQHSFIAGENNKNSKITEQQAIKIIKLLENDNRSLAQLSRDLDISLNILYDINRCKTWKYLHHYQKNIRNEARKVVMPI